MDYLTIGATEGGKDIHILVITDHFTRYAQANVTSLLPEKILTDQDCNFESDLLKALCEIAQVEKIRTSGYHLQNNGQCKCFNVTLISIP